MLELGLPEDEKPEEKERERESVCVCVSCLALKPEDLTAAEVAGDLDIRPG